MRTSEAAAAAEVNVQTLRYYERRGLLLEPARRGAGYRDYDVDTVRRVRFIKRAQDLGFSLGEVRELLELRDRRRSSAAVRQVAATKIRDIDERLRRLGLMREALSGLIDACRCGAASHLCPIIEALDDQTGSAHDAGTPRVRSHATA